MKAVSGAVLGKCQVSYLLTEDNYFPQSYLKNIYCIIKFYKFALVVQNQENIKEYIIFQLKRDAEYKIPLL